MSTYPNGCPILNAEDRYLYEERCGIIQFDGGTTRETAEQEAWKQMSSYLLGRQNQAAYDALRPRRDDI
jgi:hypothetical protein